MKVVRYLVKHTALWNIKSAGFPGQKGRKKIFMQPFIRQIFTMLIGWIWGVKSTHYLVKTHSSLKWRWTEFKGPKEGKYFQSVGHYFIPPLPHNKLWPHACARVCSNNNGRRIQRTQVLHHNTFIHIHKPENINHAPWAKRTQIKHTENKKEHNDAVSW